MHWCVVLDKLTVPEMEWWETSCENAGYCNECQEVKIGDNVFVDGPCPDCGNQELLEAETETGDRWPGFSWRFVAGKTQLYAYSDTSQAPEGFVALARRFLTAFRPKSVISFSWGYGSTAPEPDAFGGGSVVIAAWGEEWMNTGMVEVKLLEAIEAARPTNVTAMAEALKTGAEDGKTDTESS